MASNKNDFGWMEWKIFTSKLFAGGLVITSLILLMCFIIFCLVLFPSKGMSSGMHDLGLYGDFIGGIGGIILSMASLGVTIYLAIILQRIEQENAKASNETQIKAVIMQMKFQELTTFRSKCDIGFDLIEKTTTNPAEAEEGVAMIQNQTIRLLSVFPELRLRMEFEARELLSSLQELERLIFGVKMDINEPYYGSKPYVVVSDLFKAIKRSSELYYSLLDHLGNWVRE